MKKPTEAQPSALVDVHARLFPEDVETLKRMAVETGTRSWQIELRLLVRRALKGERREFLVLKEGK